jgi:urease accessory protein
MSMAAATPMAMNPSEVDGGSLLPLFIWLSPGFPVGAFAYSHGLEWAVEAGDVVDAGSLQSWLADLMEFGAPRSDAFLFSAGFRFAAAADWPALIETNALAVALTASAERRLETTAQGAAFIAAARAAWDCEPLRRLDEALGQRVAYPIAVAAAAGGHCAPLEASVQAFALAQAANLISAALRLSAIGQTEGQKVLAALLPRIKALAREAVCANLADLGGAAFRSDIAAMRHETQYSRLFRS